MRIVVDTYNVLHVTGVLPPEQAGLDVAGLVALVRASRWVNVPVTLVCDGAPPGDEGIPTGRMLGVQYAGGGRSADDAIARIVEESTAPRRLMVVTLDRAVQAHARRRQCRIMRSDVFLGLLIEPGPPGDVDKGASRPTGPLDREQVRDWRRAFGLDEEGTGP